MSLNNIENIGFNALTNLFTINADEVNTDILTKIDPDISDQAFDTLEGIHTYETIQQQFDNIEGQIGAIGTSYWFSCFDTTTQTNPVGNTPRAMIFNNSTGNGIVTTSTPGAIKVLNTNVYNIQFSVEVKSSTSSKSELTIWLRKNGNDIPSTASEYDMKGNDFYTIGWNFVEQLNADDYIQLMWASSDTTMTLYYQPVQTTPYNHPAIPSVIITVTNVTGEGAQGQQGIQGEQGIQGDRGAKGDKGDKGEKGDPGSGTVDDVARGLAGTALALATAAEATAISAQITAAGAVAANGVQDTSILALQVKTQNIQYLLDNGGTEINNNVYIPRSTTTIDPPAVRLDNNSASFFNYGITSSDLISTTDRFQSTSGTSLFNQVGINRTNRNQKKIILYDNETDDDYEYLGIFTSSSGTSNYFNCEIDGLNDEVGSAFRWNIGNSFGNGRILLKELNLKNDISYTDNAIFLKKNGFAQNIVLTRDIPNKTVKINMLGDPAGLNDFDGQIIQKDGNGVTDNTGTMTIQSGTLELNSLIADTTITSEGKINLNADDEINISATSLLGKIKISTDTNDIEINSAGSISLSSGVSYANSINITTNTATNDIVLTNNVTNTFTIDTPGTLNINNGNLNVVSNGDLDLTSNVGAINLTSSDAISLTSTAGKIEMLPNLTFEVTTTAGNIVLNTPNEILLTSTGITQSDCNGFFVNAIDDLQLISNDDINIQATTNLNLMCSSTGTGDINIKNNGLGNILMGTTVGQVIFDSYGEASFKTQNGAMNFSTVTSGSINFNSASTHDINFTTTGVGGNINLHSSNDMNLLVDSGNLNLKTTTGGDILLQPGNNRILNLVTTGLGDVNITGAENTTIKSTTGNMLLTAPASTGTITLNAPGDIIVNAPIRTNYDPASIDTNNLGYTYSEIWDYGVSPSALSEIWQFTLPSKGVWLIIVGFTWSANTSNNIEEKQILVSATSASSIECAYGLTYFEQINDSAGGAGVRQRLTMSGVYFNSASTKTLYVNARSQVGGGTRPDISIKLSYTKLG